MFVKTTKGIYDVIWNNYHSAYNTIGIYPQKIIEKDEVVAQSDGLNELIDVACFVNKNNKNQRHFYHPKVVYSQLYQEEYCHEMLIVIGMIWCGDDLVKVAEWDTDKGEWKLYER